MRENLTTSHIEQYLSTLAEQVDEALDTYLPQPEKYTETFNGAIRYSVCGAGKRLRAALVLEANYVCGGERNDALPVAAAIEMVHAYSLVHDDLPCMDDDDMRRGKPANHVVYGEGTAVLVGDALLTHAFMLLSQLPGLQTCSAATALQIISEIASGAGVKGMIGGQVADLQAEGKAPDADMLQYIHSRKTGALIRAATRSGAILAGANEEQLDKLTQFAHHFGLAFQIVDDLLDVVGDPKQLGKEVGSDKEQNKMTFPLLYGVEKSQQFAHEHIAQAEKILNELGQRATTLQALTDYVVNRQG